MESGSLGSFTASSNVCCHTEEADLRGSEDDNVCMSDRLLSGSYGVPIVEKRSLKSFRPPISRWRPVLEATDECLMNGPILGA